MSSSSTACSLVVPSLALVTAGLLFAGPLDPPAGPLAPTYKTLGEVEPRIAVNSTNTPGDAGSLYRITQPGSYYLTGNITGVVLKHGIKIETSGVTLDLMGFDLVGISRSLDGVSVVGAMINVAVVNGTVRNWDGDGVDLATSIPINTRVEKVHASSNGGTGILTSSGSTVVNCSAAFNVASGIHTGNGGAVANCSATGNGAIGISTLGGCSVTNCSAYQNSGHGIQVGVGCTVADSSSYDNGGRGINATSGGSITNCSANTNAADGIYTTGASVTNCTSGGNVGYGIYVGSTSAVMNCSVSGTTGDGFYDGGSTSFTNCSSVNNTGRGIYAGSYSTLTTCTAMSNDGDGIQTLGSALVSGCNVFQNQGHGINVSNGSTVVECNVIESTLDGIRLSVYSVARGNTCKGNGFSTGDGANIHATSIKNRIEGNTCLNADRGIDLDAAANVIIGNTCGGNGINFEMVANNFYGAIVNRVGVATAFVSGDFAPTAMGTTDPHANFTH